MSDISGTTNKICKEGIELKVQCLFLTKCDRVNLFSVVTLKLAKRIFTILVTTLQGELRVENMSNADC